MADTKLVVRREPETFTMSDSIYPDRTTVTSNLTKEGGAYYTDVVGGFFIPVEEAERENWNRVLNELIADGVKRSQDATHAGHWEARDFWNTHVAHLRAKLRPVPEGASHV